MANKRAVAREWKRKKRQQRLISRLVVVGVCVLVAIGAGYVAWDMWSRTYVMTFEGQRIPTNDMRFLTLFSEGQMDPRMESLERLTQFLLLDQAARRHNIALTVEERAEVEETTVEMIGLYEMFGIDVPSIPNERMVDFMGMEILAERLMDLYVPGVEIDETEFLHTFLEYLAFNRINHAEMDFRIHISDSDHAAWTTWDDLHAVDPEEWDDVLLREMSLATGFDIADLEVQRVTLSELREEQHFDWAVVERAFTIAEGEFSEPIQVAPETWLIFIADSFYSPSDYEIQESFRERFEIHQRLMEFSGIMQSWREAADIRVNPRGINAV